MCREEVVIWAGRGLLYADKPTYRKAAPSKMISTTVYNDNKIKQAGAELGQAQSSLS